MNDGAATDAGPGRRGRDTSDLEGREVLHWVARLALQAGLFPLPADVADHLAVMHATLAQVASTLAAPRQEPDPFDGGAALRPLQDAVAALEKQQSRAGREQLKANTLAEAQLQTLQMALDRLESVSVGREREVAAAREQAGREREEGRLEVIRDLLPTFDGLEDAVAAGNRLLATVHTSGPDANPPTPEPARRGIRRLAAAILGTKAPQDAHAYDPALRAAFSAWVEGLTMVRDRLLGALSAQGVRAIPSVGETFDPYRHVAVETVAAENGTASGTILREHRRGFSQGERVLRYAEVVVARRAVEDQK